MSASKMKRIFGLFFYVLIVVSLLAGCGATSATQAPPVQKPAGGDAGKSNEEPMKLSMLYAIDGVEFNKPTLFQQIIKEKFNIDIEYYEVAPNNFQKIEILFATGEYPEFFPQMWYNEQVVNYRRDNFLLPLNDLYDKMPNVTKRYLDADWADFLKNTAHRGENHFIPVYNYRKASECWVYKKSDFDKWGLQPPKTTDEMYDTLMTIKTNYIENLVLSMRYGPLTSVTSTFEGIGGGTRVNPYTNSFEIGVDNPEYREYLKYAKKLYDTGLLPVDFPTWSSSQHDNAVAQKEIVFVYGYATDEQGYKTRQAESDPDAVWAISPYYVTSTEGKKGFYRKEKPWFDWGMAISDKTPDYKLDRIAEMINWFAAEEQGGDFLFLGPEGVTYDIVDDWYVFKDKYDTNPENSHVVLDWSPFQEEGFGINGIAYADYIVLGTTDLGRGPATRVKKSATDFLWEDIITPQLDNLVTSPRYRMDYTPTEEKNNTNWATAINDIIGRNELSFIMQNNVDPANDGDWDKFMTELNDAGLQDWKAMLYEVYERSN